MSKIFAVLVVPAEADSGGLLWNPPRLRGTNAGQWHFEGRPPWVETPDSRQRALPLWWDGALVPEGWDRARRVAARHQLYTHAHGGDRGEFVDLAIALTDPDRDEVIEVADALVRARLASRVVRLTRIDRIDGRLAEVTSG